MLDRWQHQVRNKIHIRPQPANRNLLNTITSLIKSRINIRIDRVTGRLQLMTNLHQRPPRITVMNQLLIKRRIMPSRCFISCLMQINGLLGNLRPNRYGVDALTVAAHLHHNGKNLLIALISEIARDQVAIIQVSALTQKNRANNDFLSVGLIHQKSPKILRSVCAGCFSAAHFCARFIHC